MGGWGRGETHCQGLVQLQSQVRYTHLGQMGGGGGAQQQRLEVVGSKGHPGLLLGGKRRG